MKSITPKHVPVKPHHQEDHFNRPGIRIHRAPSAKSIGARTVGEQMQDAAKTALRNDPIIDGALPQNRIGRYANIGLPDQT